MTQVKSNGPMKTIERTIRRLIGRDWERFQPEVRPAAEPQQLSLEIYSTYCHNVPAELLEMQAKVFKHLGLPLQQVEFGADENDDKVLHRGHGETIEHLIRESSADLLIFFDIDCIPLNRGIIEYGYLPSMLAGCLVGPAQRANHIDRLIYAAPSAIGFPRSLYSRVGSPALGPTKVFDVCGKFTHACESQRIPVIKLPPVSSLLPKYSLYNDTEHHYGHGTTYAGGIFHSFEIRLGSTRDMFLDKCREVLATTPPDHPLGPITAILPQSAKLVGPPK